MESVRNSIYLHLMNRYVFCALKNGSNIYILILGLIFPVGDRLKPLWGTAIMASLTINTSQSGLKSVNSERCHFPIVILDSETRGCHQSSSKIHSLLLSL